MRRYRYKIITSDNPDPLDALRLTFDQPSHDGRSGRITEMLHERESRRQKSGTLLRSGHSWRTGRTPSVGTTFPAILAHHAPEMIMFDLPPPLQCKGLEAYAETWGPFFANHELGGAFDIKEFSITAGNDVAFRRRHNMVRTGIIDSDRAGSWIPIPSDRGPLQDEGIVANLTRAPFNPCDGVTSRGGRQDHAAGLIVRAHQSLGAQRSVIATAKPPIICLRIMSKAPSGRAGCQFAGCERSAAEKRRAPRSPARSWDASRHASTLRRSSSILSTHTSRTARPSSSTRAPSHSSSSALIR